MNSRDEKIAARARMRLGLRLAARPAITYDDALPINVRRAEIAKAINDHQVIVVCGETGSGKTTQLPKICLELGRGCAGLIGHTQPRRIAASATASRIAQELKSELGRYVGYKIRFTDKVSPETYIKLMTDGILLAETQRDRWLAAYDTILIDEAHERSLNIDFLLGHLKQILPRRRDLKVIVTSATLDAERFSKHFDGAPVIEVSGRLYPIETRYRPWGGKPSPSIPLPKGEGSGRLPSPPGRRDGDEGDLNDAIIDAVSEAQREGPGDVLVFLPGEREIREAAEALRKHAFGKSAAGLEILPLYARLTAQEQSRIFTAHQGRRVVLATNVAETSLTVPGIRYVIDSGLARVKRYSHRNKVEQLQVEPIAQSAAKQRAGRCGRVSSGVCFRLYDEIDFNKRPAYTEPEILRSSLAGVILRMKSLGLGDVEDFPFLEAPAPRMIADGYQLLAELGAVDEGKQLTTLGTELAKLPLDPKVGRMILAARDFGCLTEMLVIAAALSVQDPRDRPQEQASAADQAHAKWKDEKSEFLSWLKLWKDSEEIWKHETSNKQRQWCRQHFVSWMRMREWRDVHTQLVSLCHEHGWKESSAYQHADPLPPGGGGAGERGSRVKSTLSPAPLRAPGSALQSRAAAQAGSDASGIPCSPHQWRGSSSVVAYHGRGYDAIHKALLTGLLGNIGLKSEDEPHYLGAHGIKFFIHPGSALVKKAGRWIVVAELVETSRLFARCVAKIEPEWLEEVGAHLVKRHVFDPHWEKGPGQVAASERATLHGLVIHARQRIHYGPLDEKLSREILIRSALVNGEVNEDWSRKWRFFQHNQKLMRDIEHLEHKSRRPDVLVDEELIHAFYDARLAQNIVTLAAFDHWRREAEQAEPRLLYLEREQLMRHEAAGITTDAFPPGIEVRGQKLMLAYKHEPGAADDGVTLAVPLAMLNQVSATRCEWLVPGLLKEKLIALLKTLPQKYRHRLQPIDAFAQDFCAQQQDRDEALLRALSRSVEETLALKLPLDAFRPGELRAHLSMNFRLLDEHGATLAYSRSLSELRAQYGERVTEGYANAEIASRISGNDNAGERCGLIDWSFGPLPELLEVKVAGRTTTGFPALVDNGASVSLRAFDTEDKARSVHRAGLRRMFALALREQVRYIDKSLPGVRDLTMRFIAFGTEQELKEHLLAATLDRVCMAEPWPADGEAFEARIVSAKPRFVLVAQEIARLVDSILIEYALLHKKLAAAQKAFPLACADIAAQTQRLLAKAFVVDTPYERLSQFPRYLKAANLRLEKLRADPVRDVRLMADWQSVGKPFEREYLQQLRGGGVERADPFMQEFRWLLEELRVMLFAQELRTPSPVSVKRLQKMWDGRRLG